MPNSEIEGWAQASHLIRDGLFLLHFHHGLWFKQMQPSARVTRTEHCHAKGRNEWPVLVTVCSLHLRDDVLSGVQSADVILPGRGLA